MITAEQKIAIGARLVDECAALEGWKAVAKKVGAHQNVVRYFMQDPDEWHQASDKMWLKVATALGMKLDIATWQLVETANVRTMRKHLRNAQQQSLFLAISYRAGSGKSVGVALHRQADTDHATYVLECKEAWSHKTFLQKLAQTVGVAPDGLTVAGLIEEITAFFKRRAVSVAPLLVLDEAANLSPRSLRVIKPLYNELKGQLGLVIVGADDLERNIKSGVRRQVRGYDEIDSRLGRKFMHLEPIGQDDVYAIGQANGVTADAALAQLWAAMNPQRVALDGEYRWVTTDDLRRLERLIIGNRLKTAPVHAA